MTNVLLAIDGPLYGKVITDFVLNHQWVPGTNFKLMHAVEPPRGVEAWPEARLNDEEAVAAKTMLKAMAARIEKSLPECKVNCKVCLGYPKEEILTEAKEWPAHMIVMASHGRRRISAIVLAGSYDRDGVSWKNCCPAIFTRQCISLCVDARYMLYRSGSCPRRGNFERRAET